VCAVARVQSDNMYLRACTYIVFLTTTRASITVHIYMYIYNKMIRLPKIIYTCIQNIIIYALYIHIYYISIGSIRPAQPSSFRRSEVINCGMRFSGWWRRRRPWYISFFNLHNALAGLSRMQMTTTTTTTDTRGIYIYI